MNATITIFRNGSLIGQGNFNRDQWSKVSQCDAQLGPDATTSEETFDLIDEAIRNGEESVNRPDGVYSWSIEEPTW